MLSCRPIPAESPGARPARANSPVSHRLISEWGCQRCSKDEGTFESLDELLYDGHILPSFRLYSERLLSTWWSMLLKTFWKFKKAKITI